jgi:hypothetical protein
VFPSVVGGTLSELPPLRTTRGSESSSRSDRSEERRADDDNSAREEGVKIGGCAESTCCTGARCFSFPAASEYQ